MTAAISPVYLQQHPPTYTGISPHSANAHGSLSEQCRDMHPCLTTPESPLGFQADLFHTSEDEDELPEKRLEMRNKGELAEEEVADKLSNLGLSATGLEHVYQYLSLPRHSLSDISILCNYVHLQKLELPHNKIKDLSCVSHMPYLIILDASHNELTDFFGFKPPKNLKEVDFSHNQISEMKDLSDYSSLKKLNLDYNHFQEIRGLEKCASLAHLSLAHNQIGCISGLDNLPLKHLCLRGNLIQTMENLQTLWPLQVLDLACNRIHSLAGLQNLHLLGTLNLESNRISEIKEATHVHDLQLLRELNLKRNPVQDQPDYRLAVIFLLQHLTGLDEQRVTAEEKVSSVNKYDPPPEVVAARDHMMHQVYRLMQPQVILDSTLPGLDTPYPMLVLTGPQACGKRELAHKLCQEYSDYFAYGACHTTRAPYFGEENGADYHFVTEEEFRHMIHMGKFVQTMQYGGHWYGLSQEAIETVAREGLACVVHMELEGVFSLKSSHFEPRYVLLIPTSVETYSWSLKARGLYTQEQVERALARIHTYSAVHRDKPGFFDNVIPCDDRKEAYLTLRQSVREYLGLVEQERTPATTPSPDNTSTGGMTSDSLVMDRGRGQSRAELSTKSPASPDEELAHSANYRSKLQAELTPDKTSAASISRRRQMVQEALMGRSPAAYSQLFKRCANTAPSALTSTQRHAGGNPPYPDDDSSSDESRASSGLSMRSSAGAFSVTASPAAGASGGVSAQASDADMGGASSTLALGLPVEPLDISALTPSSHKDSSEPVPTPDAPRGGMSGHLSPSSAAPSAASPYPSRPGSNAKPILPPIPSGRKTAEPPVPDPAPGPGPTPTNASHS
ncbi:leucine-rich repeat and guanylate kinase domain-containing protein isoform X2 [Engraulis encrasicolus]|uniref:leucine-rich repeat and guanylate kinase domain-containing protein isoform X2 n=1 Tax=Engraulis encrasicolus TaxID=184585 RepID=UPI002FD6104A